MIAHEVPRLSADVDVTLRIVPDDPERFAHEMAQAGFDLAVDDPEFVRPLSDDQPHAHAVPDVQSAGYAIGSRAVESAVSHVVQQRMKRVGMRWRSTGADAMLALRSIYPNDRGVAPILGDSTECMNGCRLHPRRGDR